MGYALHCAMLHAAAIPVSVLMSEEGVIPPPRPRHESLAGTSGFGELLAVP